MGCKGPWFWHLERWKAEPWALRRDLGVRRGRGGGCQRKEGVRCQEGGMGYERRGRGLAAGGGIAAKPAGSHGGCVVSVCLQPLPASLFPAISPIPGVSQDSGKAAGLGKVRCRGRQDRRGSRRLVGWAVADRAGNWGRGWRMENEDEGWHCQGLGVSSLFLSLPSAPQLPVLPTNLKIWVRRGW